jgi:protein XRP2
MGCSSSSSIQKKEKVSKEYTFGKTKGLNPKDYMIVNLTGACVVRSHIGGQQFIIEDCKDCIIFILDHIASLTIDNCTNVRIISGPVNSSIFVRNCIDCKFSLSSKQLRLRECENCDFFIYTTTGPIIESSKNIGFSCSTLNYFSISAHFKSADLNIWLNSWFDVYDFTENQYSLNYFIMQEDKSFNTFFNGISSEIYNTLSQQLDNEGVLLFSFLDGINSNSSSVENIPYLPRSCKIYLFIIKIF